MGIFPEMYNDSLTFLTSCKKNAISTVTWLGLLVASFYLGIVNAL